jgi:hypothetical protein
MGTEQRTGPTAAQHLPAGPTRMKAIVQDVYGEADVLRLVEIDRPEPGADEVLLRVHAAGVDRGVWHIMTGLPTPSGWRATGCVSLKTEYAAVRSPDGSRPSARTSPP